jgi:hypothetical protein
MNLSSILAWEASLRLLFGFEMGHPISNPNYNLKGTSHAKIELKFIQNS